MGTPEETVLGNIANYQPKVEKAHFSTRVICLTDSLVVDFPRSLPIGEELKSGRSRAVILVPSTSQQRNHQAAGQQSAFLAVDRSALSHRRKRHQVHGPRCEFTLIESAWQKSLSETICSQLSNWQRELQRLGHSRN